MASPLSNSTTVPCRKSSMRSTFRLPVSVPKNMLTCSPSRDWIVKHAPQHALIERAQAMPKQGASSGFKYGRAVGAIEAVITCCAIPLTIVEPSIWKKFHALRGGDKEAGRQRALQLFPAAHALLARKKDHGRAEAALIALAGAPR